MTDIRRAKTMPASLATRQRDGGLPPRRSSTQMSQEALSEASPFSLREFFHGQAGHWPWVKQDADGVDSDSGPVSMTTRRAVFDFDGMHAATSDSDSDSSDCPETPGGGGNEEEKRIWREDKLGVLRMSTSH